MSFTEQEMERGDYLRDEQRDRAMEERDEVARRSNPIQSELSRLRAENARLRAFVESIVTVTGPYRELNGTQIVADAYAALNPVKHETAPPVPESLARTLASHRGPRYFSGVGATDEVQWKFAGGQMFIRDASGGWESSICSVKDLQECLDTVECNEDFEPLAPADDRGDREQQREADES